MSGGPTFPTEPSGTAGSFYKQFMGFFFEKRGIQNLANAKAVCSGRDGNLATFRTEEELIAVKTYMGGKKVATKLLELRVARN